MKFWKRGGSTAAQWSARESNVPSVRRKEEEEVENPVCTRSCRTTLFMGQKRKSPAKHHLIGKHRVDTTIAEMKGGENRGRCGRSVGRFGYWEVGLCEARLHAIKRSK